MASQPTCLHPFAALNYLSSGIWTRTFVADINFLCRTTPPATGYASLVGRPCPSAGEVVDVNCAYRLLERRIHRQGSRRDASQGPQDCLRNRQSELMHPWGT